MKHFLFLLPIVALLASACGEKPAPQKTAADIPSYSQAAETIKQQSKAAMAKKLSAADQAIIQQAGEDLARRLPDPGLNIGDRAPDFSLPDANGDTVTLSALLKQGPVVVVFYRGAWCPYCNLHLHTLYKSLPQIRQLGAQLVAITPQKPDKSAAQAKKAGYPFHVLSDLDSSVMKDYKLYYELEPELLKVYKKLGFDLADYNGEGRYVLPVPGTFVIDTNGIVQARHATTDYTQRMEPADIITALQKIRG